eukprot:1278027-Rhodomonas_salina.1
MSAREWGGVTESGEGQRGMTALHMAAQSGHRAAAQGPNSLSLSHTHTSLSLIHTLTLAHAHAHMLALAQLEAGTEESGRVGLGGGAELLTVAGTKALEAQDEEQGWQLQKGRLGPGADDDRERREGGEVEEDGRDDDERERGAS